MKVACKNESLRRAVRDEIDNAVFTAIFSLCPSKDCLQWDESLIGEATDAIKSVMERYGLKAY